MFDQISIDSRTIKPRDVFWAIQGKKHDGHHFIEAALHRGALACVVSERHQSQTHQDDQPLIIVQDTIAAFQRYAAWLRQQHPALVIGITGSYGKTTTREMVHATLSAKYSGMRSPRNYNNEIGVPLTLLELKQHHEFLAIELGAAQPDDVQLLARIVQPTIGIITGIGPAHLKGLVSLEQITKTKGDLIAALPQDGLAVLPGDSEWITELKRRSPCRVITCGFQRENTFRATHVESSNHHVDFKANHVNYHLPVAGRHHVSAALAAIAVGSELGLSSTEIQAGLCSFQPASARTQVEKLTNWTVINDTYNANPVSMRAACEMLAEWKTSGRRFLVLGDMLELEESSTSYHHLLGEFAASQRIDFLFAYGTYANHVIDGAKQSKQRVQNALATTHIEELINNLLKHLEPGDTVLVKGSRGTRMERVVEALRAA